jgi:hypothetical protein
MAVIAVATLSDTIQEEKPEPASLLPETDITPPKYIPEHPLAIYPTKVVSPEQDAPKEAR